jgi:hypothetical protein
MGEGVKKSPSSYNNLKKETHHAMGRCLGTLILELGIEMRKHISG